MQKLYHHFNSCVHYFSIKSCVHICHTRDKSRKTITVRFIGLKKLHEYILNGLNSQLNDGLTSLPVNFRFYRMLKILHQKIRREISGGVFKGIFDLRPHLVVNIVNFEPFVTGVTDMDATVNGFCSIVVHIDKQNISKQMTPKVKKVSLDCSFRPWCISIRLNSERFSIF